MAQFALAEESSEESSMAQFAVAEECDSGLLPVGLTWSCPRYQSTIDSGALSRVSCAGTNVVGFMRHEDALYKSVRALRRWHAHPKACWLQQPDGGSRGGLPCSKRLAAC
ncbi:hypothetical protein HaLaN_06224 [Haematococcus lacustris]|uniref:Uncharacterized protein n=1 Tax=Haematococcus lacustris TaxID=44745 RepID=A0A699YNF3_HAELA|nr:hypothetical protein HaLaN_06224 [Haematococcus lacustris]